MSSEPRKPAKAVRNAPANPHEAASKLALMVKRNAEMALLGKEFMKPEEVAAVAYILGLLGLAKEMELIFAPPKSGRPEVPEVKVGGTD